MTSLEGVWRTGVRAAELETLMLLSSRGYPLLTVANGPLLARRSWWVWRVHRSGGLLCNLANSWYLPAEIRSLVSWVAVTIPRIFQIMGTVP